MSKKESREVARQAKTLATLLNKLSVKYCDENEFGPGADFYAKDYEALQKLEDEMTWWMT